MTYYLGLGILLRCVNIEDLNKTIMNSSDIKKDLVIVLTTEKSLNKAKILANKLLEKKYAACISFSKINSFFWWNGKIDSSNEIQIMIKTTYEKLNKLLTEIKMIHSYDSPELIYWKIESSESYKTWACKVLNVVPN